MVKYREAHARAVRKYNREKLVSIDIRLPKSRVGDDLRDRWKAAAAEQGIPMSQLIYNAMESYLNNKKAEPVL